MAENFDLIAPYRGVCGLCGEGDARHGEYDAIWGLYLAGDPIALIAEDFSRTEDNVRAIVNDCMANYPDGPEGES